MKLSNRHFFKFGVLIIGSALALAACSSSSSTPAKPKPSTGYSSPTTSSSTVAPTKPVSSSVAVKTAHSSIGTVLVNGSGMVLYTLSSATATSSPCDTSKCLGIWPPVSGSSRPSVGTGVSSAHFGVLTLPNGAKQLTYYGHPLYLFSGDSAAGQTNGEGLAFPVGSAHPTAHWYALSPSGTFVVKSSSSTSTSTSSSGYGSSSSTGSTSSGYGSSTSAGSTPGYSSSTTSGSTSPSKTASSSSGGWKG